MSNFFRGIRSNKVPQAPIPEQVPGRQDDPLAHLVQDNAPALHPQQPLQASIQLVPVGKPIKVQDFFADQEIVMAKSFLGTGTPVNQIQAIALQIAIHLEDTRHENDQALWSLPPGLVDNEDAKAVKKDWSRNRARDLSIEGFPNYAQVIEEMEIQAQETDDNTWHEQKVISAYIMISDWLRQKIGELPDEIVYRGGFPEELAARLMLIDTQNFTGNPILSYILLKKGLDEKWITTYEITPTVPGDYLLSMTKDHRILLTVKQSYSIREDILDGSMQQLPEGIQDVQTLKKELPLKFTIEMNFDIGDLSRSTAIIGQEKERQSFLSWFKK